MTARDVTSPVEAYTLDRYLAEVSAILDRQTPLSDQVAKIAAAKRKLVSNALVLPPDLRKIHPTAP